MNETNSRCSRFLALAEELAAARYGCDLDRLDPAEMAWYTDRIPASYWEMELWAEAMAEAAWYAY